MNLHNERVNYVLRGQVWSAKSGCNADLQDLAKKLIQMHKKVSYLAHLTGQQIHHIGVVFEAEDRDYIVCIQGYAEKGCQLLLCL